MATQTYGSGFQITPSDSNDLPSIVSGIYVGGTGALRVLTLDGKDVTFAAVPAGTTIPLQVKRVLASGTGATLLVGLTD